MSGTSFLDGLDDTVAVDATIRPAWSEDEVAPTVAAPAPRETTRWPRLSVDLEGSTDRRPASTADAPGKDLEVRGLIGEGGMGRVFLARQRSLERDVAVKTVRDQASEGVRWALLREGVITGKLEHPSIVPVHALGLDDQERPVMVMKRIEGVAWDELASDPAHDAWEAWGGDASDRLLGHLQILIQVCNAAHFAHEHGVVHRDIKPENVLLGRYGEVYLADWGVAGEVGETQSYLCGTPGYLAPEMARGEVIDARTDVFLLGATLHAVLLGEPPHDGTTVQEVVEAARHPAPFDYPPSIPAELATLLHDACAAQPDDRIASAFALRGRITRFLQHRDAEALTDEALERLDSIEDLDALEEPTDEERHRLEERLVEARYGLERALAMWPESERARAAQARLDAVVERRRAQAAAVEHIARQHDPKRERAIRSWFLGGTALVSLPLTVLGVAVEWNISAVEIAIIPFVFLLASGVAYMVPSVRRRARASRVNWDLYRVFVVIMGLVAVGRLAGVVEGQSVVTQLARDSFMLAAVFMVMALVHFRALAWVGIVFLASWGGCLLVPHYAVALFIVLTTAAIGLTAYIVR